jgi:eukaryotic-like serine/threonine-protein kinase
MLERYGRYEALRKIASGGMATVYLGRVSGEGGFERLVALKVMHPHIAGDPDFLAMFMDEARLAAQIRHPNVVATIDIQKTPDATFLVMDYVDGPSLQDVRKFLRQHGLRLPIEIALRIFVDVLNGLQEAHDLTGKDGECLNLVHRDISPHNILVGRDGVARLTDFGVARAEARISSTRGGQLKGKIAYMPPEQITADPVTRQSDIYSVGVCLWEALTGRRLFRAPNDGAMVHVILAGETPPPSKYAPCPPAIERIIMQALARYPEERFAEALDMADALETAARQAGIRIPRARDVGRFIKRIADEIDAAPPGPSGFSEPTGTPPGEADGASHPSLSFESRPSRPTRQVLDAAPMSEDTPDSGASPSSRAPMLDHSQPTSPTHTGASYTLEPPASRHGLIAIAVAGLIAVGAIIALMTSRPSPATSPPASTGVATEPTPPPAAVEPQPEVGEPKVDPVAPPGSEPVAEAEQAELPKDREPEPKPKTAAKPRPVVVPPRPTKPEPTPSSTQFRPTEL